MGRVQAKILWIGIAAAFLIGWDKIEQRDPLPVKGYRLFWKDEFSGNRLDRAKWNHRNLGWKDISYNTTTTVSVNGRGHLVLKGIIKGDSALSAQIATHESFRTTYGYFESRVKLPMSPGMLPAFWLQSQGNLSDHTDPEKKGVEMDIFEYYPNVKKDSITHTLHYGGYGAYHKIAGPVWASLKQPLNGWHVFGFEWTPERYRLFVDGKQTYSGDVLISKAPEFILFSLAVSREAALPANKQSLEDSLVVDYIRVYKKVRK